MEMTDRIVIEAPREKAWESILDPVALKECIPDCTELTGSSGGGFEAAVTRRVGPVKTMFKGRVTLSNMNAPVGRQGGAGSGGIGQAIRHRAIVEHRRDASAPLGPTTLALDSGHSNG